MSDSQVEYLTAAQVRLRFGNASAMWLHRRIRDDGFPSPVRFGTQARYFRLSEIIAWEKKMIERGVAKPKVVPPRRAIRL